MRATCLGLTLLVAAAMVQAAEPARDKPATRACPQGVPADARCLAGRDEFGAWYWIAVPAKWNGTLVLHSHGGPELGAPKSERTEEDLARWSVWPRAGFAWAGSSFRQGGVAVRSAAEDTERLRLIFNEAVGKPQRTILHGQSWGASVAARAADLFTTTGEGGKPPYDAVLLTSGVLGGGSQSYDFRLDLRVVYQAVCHNHPRPDESAYPLWQGLPEGSKMTRADLQSRVEACTGVGLPAAQRSEAQQKALKTILGAVRIPERSLLSHLAWGTWHFQDIAFKRLGGRNAFGNEGVRYTGTPDDEDLNAKVLRYRAEPKARADFAADTDPTGRIPVPVLTVHAIDDPTAFVELESSWRDTLRRAGTADHLVQVFTSDHEHSYLSDAQYVAAMQSLLGWLDRGEKPTPAGVAAACAKVDARFEPAAGCRFVPDYQPPLLSSRVPAR